MNAVTAERLLRAWEAALDERSVRRGAALLAGCLARSTDSVAAWSLTERDAGLFDLRAELFGTEATGLASCPACGDELEVTLDLSALRPGSAGPADRQAPEDQAVAARTPNSDDLLAAAEQPDEEAALAVLVARCVEPGAVPRQLARQALSARLAEVDIQLQLDCGSCGAAFQVPFDIAAFLLREVDAWARRLLRDVHVLASAYGWTERAILGMDARRRHLYIDLIEAGA
ncbi:hypothetical protein [Acrocarpospora macrocephala]|nr:hypothetical protein [Acrocarpospora macrocephala]